MLETCDKFSGNTSKADSKLKIEVRLKYSRKMYLNCSKVVPVMMKKVFLEIKTGEKIKKQLFLNLKIQMFM